jgi:hypothetical protein
MFCEDAKISGSISGLWYSAESLTPELVEDAPQPVNIGNIKTIVKTRAKIFKHKPPLLLNYAS